MPLRLFNDWFCEIKFTGLRAVLKAFYKRGLEILKLLLNIYCM